MNNTSATNKGSDESRETLELTFTQSSTSTLVYSNIENDQMTGMKTTGDYAIPSLKLERKLSDVLQSTVKSALLSLRTQFELGDGFIEFLRKLQSYLSSCNKRLMPS